MFTDRRVRLAELEGHLASLGDDDYVLGDLHAVASGGSSGPSGDTLEELGLVDPAQAP